MKSPEQARLECGFDYSHLARLSGVSGPTISRIESGATLKLRGTTLQKIGAVLCDHLKTQGVKYTIPEFIEGCIAIRDRRLNEGKR